MQGSILGSLMFNILINDMVYVTENGTLYKCADYNRILNTGCDDIDELAVLESKYVAHYVMV